jgi:hypothetical protein
MNWKTILKADGTYEVYVYDIVWDADERQKERMPLPNMGLYYISSDTDLEDDEEVLEAINDAVEDAHSFTMKNFNYRFNHLGELQ